MKAELEQLGVRSAPPAVDVRSSVIQELRTRHASRAGAYEWAAWAGLVLGAATLAFLAIDVLRDPFAQVLVTAWETAL